MVAGARAVQVGTANFVDPAAAVRIAAEMESWCEAHGVARVSDLVGTLKT
jgi:dihydroorotate dehydrogenase (NAD+) catalytic subunit